MTKTTYNPKNHLIIIKNEIKDDISFFQFDWYKINITFTNNQKPYTYISKSIKILKNPRNIAVKNNLFFNNGKLLSDIDTVLYFEWGYYRFFLKNGGIISTNRVRIEENPMQKEGVKNVLEYLQTILDSQSENEISKYLQREFEKLDTILPESVLNSFLSKKHQEKNNYLWTDHLIFPFDFNLSQKQALENIYKSNISVIQWPPGTGKTQTILNMIANLAIMQDKTVGIVSNNNSAIANVQEKLEKEKYGFFTALLWNKENKESFFEKTPELVKFNSENSEDNVSKLEEISELMEKNNSKQQLKTQLAEYELEQQHFEEYFQKQNITTIFRHPFLAKSSQRLMEFLAENTQQSKKRKKKGLFFKLRMFFKYGFTEFEKLNTDEINMILSYQKAFYSLKIWELSDWISELDQVLLADNYKNLLWEYKKYSKIVFQNKLNKKFQQADFGFTAKNYKHDFFKFINRFPVILSSTHAVVSSVPKGFLFDYLIIDESSQVDLVTGILAFSCCKNVIIVWDTKQLPHIPTGKPIENNTIEACFDYYKHNILSSVLEIYKKDIPVVLLKEHYRCHPKIINFCNQKYYNWELVIYTKEQEGDKPLTIYRSAEWNHMRNIEVTDHAWKYNQRELDIIENILKQEFHRTKSLEHVGVIAPFRKQVEKADIQFQKYVEVNTVHKFQWREKDIIIMSTVLDNNQAKKWTMKFADNASLLNVAVSRAKDKLIIVTDYNLFFQQWRELRDLIQYIEYSTLDTNIIESDIVWVFDLLYKNYSDKINLNNSKLMKISQFKSEDIWNALITKILQDDRLNNLSFTREVYLKNLISNTSKLNEDEKKFLHNNSRVDFLIYSQFWKAPVLVIEVDWTAFHENNPPQIERDKKKNSILEKYNIPCLRLKTNGSWEEKRVYEKLLKIVWES